MTFCLASTEDYENVLSFYMFGDSGDAVEDSTVDIVLLPIDDTTYKNVSDESVWAVTGVAVKMDVNKYSYLVSRRISGGIFFCRGRSAGDCVVSMIGYQ